MTPDQKHYPVEFGPSDNRRLECSCGNPDPAHADGNRSSKDVTLLRTLFCECGQPSLAGTPIKKPCLPCRAAAEIKRLTRELEAERLLRQGAWRALERWSHDGHLQTFEDRERFRAEARAMLYGEPARSAPETTERCVWTRMQDDEQRWMQPVRFHLACADEIARGRYPFYPDNCPQCGKPVQMVPLNGEPKSAVKANECKPGFTQACSSFGDDPDAPGCCSYCGHPREAHPQKGPV